MIGQTLGHYRILEKIGAGGMGVVYRAYDERLERDVALKVLPPGTLADEAAHRRFRKEALALSKLNHPNIETIHDFDSQDGVDFLVVEYIPGVTLSDKLAAGAVTEKEIASLGTQLTEGLGAAHEQGVVHRDLKPGNLRITPDGRLKILDFGLAKLLRPTDSNVATETITDAKVVAGTLPYMSPEQLRGEHVDARTDIYAMGIVLYEMATGQRPFREELAPKLIDAIFHQAPTAPHSIHTKVNPELERMILKCLEKEPEDRYQSAKEVGVDLRRLKRDTESSRTAVIEQAPPAARSRPALRYAGAAAALAVLVAGGFYVRHSMELRRVRALVASLEPAAESGHFDEVAGRLQAAGVDLRDARLEGFAKRISGTVSISSDPPGAVATAVRVEPIATLPARQPVTIGRTPIPTFRLVAGEYFVRLTAQGMNPVEFLARVEVGKDLRASSKMLAAGKTSDGMVLVEEGPSSTSQGKVIPAFLVDRYEVTNEKFLKFATAGGYRDLAFWPETMIKDGKPLPRAAAMQSFVDRTGVPGPRAWSGGVFPSDKANHPVVGTSWYEAAAYSRWAGKQLPSEEQWWRAALGASGGVFPWGSDVKTTDLRANFGLAGTRPVGSYPAGISPFGCYDMAGNVREWLADAMPDSLRRMVAGGSWQDPAYMFEPVHAESFDPSFAGEGIGFRLVMPAAPQR